MQLQFFTRTTLNAKQEAVNIFKPFKLVTPIKELETRHPVYSGKASEDQVGVKYKLPLYLSFCIVPTT